MTIATGGSPPLLLALALKREAHGVGVRHIAHQRLEDGILQRRSAVAFEQPRQGGGDGAEIGAAFGGAHEQGLAGGSGLREAVIGAVLTGGTLVVDQSLDMGGIFDLCPLVVAARMAGEDVRAVGDAHLMRVSEHGQNAPDMRVRDRIVVEVEADIGRLADRDRDALEQRRRVVRQSQQARRFVGEYLADSALGFVRAAPVGGRAMAPGIGLGVEIVEIGEVARGEERVTYVSYGSFHAAFLVAARDRDGPRFVAIVPSKTQQCGWKRIASPCRSSTALFKLS